MGIEQAPPSPVDVMPVESERTHLGIIEITSVIRHVVSLALKGVDDTGSEVHFGQLLDAA